MSDNRVVVAMSGGVDSSVTAAILKKKGYDVIGMTMKFWGKHNRCCSEEDTEDARQVARHLEIPHYIIPLNDSFKRHVVDYFVEEYITGRTPNPCAVCNPMIKFGDLMTKAKELKARYLATGHYAVISCRDNVCALKRGKERGKDQSYFLARLTQDILKHSLFPIGNYPKKKIRALAEKFGLPVASKTESQEVCFIPDGDVAKFIETQSGRSFPQGPIIDNTGQRVGTHKGIIGYTIGQRKGLGIALGKPAYVTRIDANTNTIHVGDGEDLYHSCFIASDAHWLLEQKNGTALRFRVRIRYKHKPDWATVTSEKRGRVTVQFDKPQRAITPGQLAVFYDGDIVAGSAWIDEVSG